MLTKSPSETTTPKENTDSNKNNNNLSQLHIIAISVSGGFVVCVIIGFVLLAVVIARRKRRIEKPVAKVSAAG